MSSSPCSGSVTATGMLIPVIPKLGPANHSLFPWICCNHYCRVRMTFWAAPRRSKKERQLAMSAECTVHLRIIATSTRTSAKCSQSPTKEKTTGIAKTTLAERTASCAIQGIWNLLTESESVRIDPTLQKVLWRRDSRRRRRLQALSLPSWRQQVIFSPLQSLKSTPIHLFEYPVRYHFTKIYLFF